MKLILASASPRRQQLLQQVGCTFTTDSDHNVDEETLTAQLLQNDNIQMHWIPESLAKAKAQAIASKHANSIIISADTIVLLNNEILNKPSNEADAVNMLHKLNGQTHKVITGVCILPTFKPTAINIFNVVTEVTFKRLTLEQINYYVNQYKPMDKAGAYAIQEWIGLIGIEKINGCYYNVMGLPMSRIYEALEKISN